MKTCNSCSRNQSLENFSSKGNGRKQAKCKDCQKAYYKNYYNSVPKERERIYAKNMETKKRFVEYINNVKASTPCTDCGNSYPPYVMDFDHVDDNKLNNVSSLKSFGNFKTLVAEIAKCEVVCSNCHRARTYLRQHPDDAQ